ncbi:SprT-like domain-containing protein [Vibrio vulnificus]
MKAPTFETYEPLQMAFDRINDRFFGGALPPVLITLQRQPNTMGYLSKNRFVNSHGEMTHELAVNPDYFSIYPITEILSTIAHEATHLWQLTDPDAKPSRNGYHNKEWANKLESIGLMPSSTGKVGGGKTGQKMSDYIIEGGIFDEFCNDIITTDFKIEWYDRFPPTKRRPNGVNSFFEAVLNNSMPISIESDIEQSEGYCDSENDSESEGGAEQEPVILQMFEPRPESKATRVKFTCSCGNNLWGKPSLNVGCLDCNEQFKPT